MAGRRKKSLNDLIRDRTFLARQHGGRLGDPLVADEELRPLQVAYRDAGSEGERRKVALAFEKAVRARPSASPLELIRDLDLAGFCEQFLRVRRGWLAGKPLRLEEWQRRFVDEFGEPDADGRRVYSTGFLLLPRGQGKTVLSVACALYELLRRPDEPEVLLAAASREQAGNVAMEHAKSLIRSSEALSDLLVVKGSEITVPETNGVLRTVSTGGAAFGGSPSVAVIDEMWLFDRDAQETMWEALQTGLGKVPDGFALVTSTAPTRDETLLGRLLETELRKPNVEQVHEALRIVRDRDGGVFTTWFGATDANCDVDDETLWMKANPATWVDVKTLRKRRAAPVFPTGRSGSFI
jgi:phage terminase large subunit-like protein